jgi:hypothetical protein
LCDACHKSSAVDFTSYGTLASLHSAVTSIACANCHNGNYKTQGNNGGAQTFSATHPAGQSPGACSNCHTTTAWSPAKFTHDATTVGKCANCHGTAGPAVMRINLGTHIPTGAITCDSCHSSSATDFTSYSASFHGVVSGTACANCHNGNYKTQGNNGGAQTFSATHPGGLTPGACNNCHSTTAWSPATGFVHDATTVNNCSKCHGAAGTAATKINLGTHIPVGAIQCDQCHTTSKTTFTIYTASFHSVVTATPCSTCHNGTYVSQGNNGGAQAKSAKHIPYEANLLGGASMTCNICHTGTTAWTTLASKTALHNGTPGNGAGWCKGCHLSGLTFSDTALQKKSLTHQKSTGVTDCSQSGCHRPLGNQGSTYSSW